MSAPVKEATLWICDSCGFVYDPAEGDPDGGIPAGNGVRGHPQGLVLPGLRGAHLGLPPLRRGLAAASPA